jgi:hypothetical protein
MNCYDCQASPAPAVAVCHLCGKGICREHCVRQQLRVIALTPGGMAHVERPTGRCLPRFVCRECAAATGTADVQGRVVIRG